MRITETITFYMFLKSFQTFLVSLGEYLLVLCVNSIKPTPNNSHELLKSSYLIFFYPNLTKRCTLI